MHAPRLLLQLVSPRYGGETGSCKPVLLLGLVVIGSAANSELDRLFMQHRRQVAYANSVKPATQHNGNPEHTF